MTGNILNQNSSEETQHSVSLVVPAFNEENNLADTITAIHDALEALPLIYEILIINDHSADATGQIADTLAAEDSRIRVLHNERNMGYGFSVLRGAKESRYEYFQLVPGDNEIPPESIRAVSSLIGPTDMVLPYMYNFEVRSFYRKLISWVFTSMMNVLFNMRLKYYNGPSAIRVKLINQTEVYTHGFAFQACILVQLVKRKYSYAQVGIRLAPRRFGKSTMVSTKNITLVLKTIRWLYWNVNVTRRLRNR